MLQTIEQVIGEKSLQLSAETSFENQLYGLGQLLMDIDSSLIQDGYTIQVGWSLYTVLEEADKLILVAPDYENKPLENTTKDLTSSLWIQSQQSQLLNSLGITGQAIKFNDKIVLANEHIFEQDAIYFHRRGDCSEGDSGWYIGATEETFQTKDLRAMYAYQLFLMKPEFVQLLALPYEYMVIFKNKKITAIVNEHNTNVLAANNA